ncbi:MAG: hypothetical protein M5R42_07160 [Rhodocyclaceae bacterium]|nr:hypothetical protein [Rhodocyclaceae bacterium]
MSSMSIDERRRSKAGGHCREKLSIILFTAQYAFSGHPARYCGADRNLAVGGRDSAGPARLLKGRHAHGYDVRFGRTAGELQAIGSGDFSADCDDGVEESAPPRSPQFDDLKKLCWCLRSRRSRRLGAADSSSWRSARATATISTINDALVGRP